MPIFVRKTEFGSPYIVSSYGGGRAQIVIGDVEPTSNSALAQTHHIKATVWDLESEIPGSKHGLWSLYLGLKYAVEHFNATYVVLEDATSITIPAERNLYRRLGFKLKNKNNRWVTWNADSVIHDSARRGDIQKIIKACEGLLLT